MTRHQLFPKRAVATKIELTIQYPDGTLRVLSASLEPKAQLAELTVYEQLEPSDNPVEAPTPRSATLLVLHTQLQPVDGSVFTIEDLGAPPVQSPSVDPSTPQPVTPPPTPKYPTPSSAVIENPL